MVDKRAQCSLKIIYAMNHELWNYSPPHGHYIKQQKTQGIICVMKEMY